MITNNTQKLYRVPNGIIAGVCGGIAEFFGLDKSLVRVAALLFILFGGLSLWIYLLLWIIIPKSQNRLTT